MGLPLEEAKRIAREIVEEFGHKGWTATVHGTENEVVVTSADNEFGFTWKLPMFAKIVKTWSFTISEHEGKIVLIIW